MGCPSANGKRRRHRRPLRSCGMLGAPGGRGYDADVACDCRQNISKRSLPKIFLEDPRGNLLQVTHFFLGSVQPRSRRRMPVLSYKIHLWSLGWSRVTGVLDKVLWLLIWNHSWKQHELTLGGFWQNHSFSVFGTLSHTFSFYQTGGFGSPRSTSRHLWRRPRCARPSASSRSWGSVCPCGSRRRKVGRFGWDENGWKWWMITESLTFFNPLVE